MNSFIGRKELAVILELSVRTVKNNEGAWGIAKFRADANRRLVRYRRAGVLKALKERKLL